MEPFRLDADEGIKDASEDQDDSCDRQGWRDAWVDG